MYVTAGTHLRDALMGARLQAHAKLKTFTVNT